MTMDTLVVLYNLEAVRVHVEAFRVPEFDAQRLLSRAGEFMMPLRRAAPSRHGAAISRGPVAAAPIGVPNPSHVTSFLVIFFALLHVLTCKLPKLLTKKLRNSIHADVKSRQPRMADENDEGKQEEEGAKTTPTQTSLSRLRLHGSDEAKMAQMMRPMRPT